MAAPLIEPIQDNVIAPFTEGLAALSAAAIRLCGGGATAAGTVLSLASGCGSVRVANGCNAIEVSILFAAAVLAFPAPIRLRLIGVAAGVGLLQGINLLRIISLLYLSCFSQSWFAFFHEYAWDAAIVLDALLIFLGWHRWQALPRRAAAC
jgi:exosortase H (IPTLxxWG-CTERM-specific)